MIDEAAPISPESGYDPAPRLRLIDVRGECGGLPSGPIGWRFAAPNPPRIRGGPDREPMPGHPANPCLESILTGQPLSGTGCSHYSVKR